MLPYTPLHHLLLAAADGPLAMTSGNLADEPMHHRPIHARADDSNDGAISFGQAAIAAARQDRAERR